MGRNIELRSIKNRSKKRHQQIIGKKEGVLEGSGGSRPRTRPRGHRRESWTPNLQNSKHQRKTPTKKKETTRDTKNNTLARLRASAVADFVIVVSDLLKSYREASRNQYSMEYYWAPGGHSDPSRLWTLMYINVTIGPPRD